MSIIKWQEIWRPLLDHSHKSQASNLPEVPDKQKSDLGTVLTVQKLEQLLSSTLDALEEILFPKTVSSCLKTAQVPLTKKALLYLYWVFRGKSIMKIHTAADDLYRAPPTETFNNIVYFFYGNKNNFAAFCRMWVHVISFKMSADKLLCQVVLNARQMFSESRCLPF